MNNKTHAYNAKIVDLKKKKRFKNNNKTRVKTYLKKKLKKYKTFKKKKKIWC
jgi:hypothetical protein